MKALTIDGTKVFVATLFPIDFWWGCQTLQDAQSACASAESHEISAELDKLRTAVDEHAQEVDGGSPGWREGESYWCGWCLGDGHTVPWVARKLDNNGTVIAASTDVDIFGPSQFE